MAADLAKYRPLEMGIDWNESKHLFEVTSLYKNGTTVVGVPVDQLFIVRIRERNATWSPGFVTPLSRHQFSGLLPNTEYEISVTRRTDDGDVTSPTVTVRTDEEGCVRAGPAPGDTPGRALNLEGGMASPTIHESDHWTPGTTLF